MRHHILIGSWFHGYYGFIGRLLELRGPIARVAWRSVVVVTLSLVASSPSPGKNNNSIIAYPPPIQSSATERTSGFRNPRYSALDACLKEVHSRLGCDFGSAFLQIPHRLRLNRVSVMGSSFAVSSDTLGFAYSFPPFRAEVGFTPTSCCPYRAHAGGSARTVGLDGARDKGKKVREPRITVSSRGVYGQLSK